MLVKTKKSKVFILFFLLIGLFVQGDFFVLAQDATTSTSSTAETTQAGSGGSTTSLENPLSPPSGTTSSGGTDTATADTGGTTNTTSTTLPPLPIINFTASQITGELKGIVHFEAHSNVSLKELQFHFDLPSSIIVPDKIFNSFTQDAAKLGWQAEINTVEIPNGTYLVWASGVDPFGRRVPSPTLTLTIKNALPEIHLTFLQPIGAEINSSVDLLAESDGLLDSGSFQIGGPKSVQIPAVLDGKYLKARWDVTGFPSGTYRLYARGIKGTINYATPGPTVQLLLSAAALPPEITPTTTSPTGVVSNIEVVLTLPKNNVTVSQLVKVSAQPSSPVAGVAFVIQGEGEVKTLGGVPENGEWVAAWDTKSVPNGKYQVLARAQAAGQIFESVVSTVTVNNTTITTTVPPVQIINLQNNSVIIGGIRLQIGVAAVVPDKVIFFLKNSLQEFSFDNAKFDASTGSWFLDFDSRNVPNGIYSAFTAVNVQGQNIYSPLLKIQIQNDQPVNSLPREPVKPTPPPPTTAPKPPINTTAEVPIELRQQAALELAKPASPSEQEKVLLHKLESDDAKARILAECREAGITEEEACRQFVYARAGVTPECARVKVMTSAACREYMQLTLECKNEGVLTLEACKRIMLLRYRQEKAAAGSTTSELCQTQDDKECQQEIKDKFFPQECIEAQLKDLKSCEEYMLKKYLPAECVEAGAATNEGCAEVVRNRYFKQECSEQKITDPAACQKYIFDRYVSTVKCDGLDEVSCQEILRRRHLGGAALDVKKTERINQLVEPSLNASVALMPRPAKPKAEERNIDTIEDAVPILVNQERKVLFVPARGEALLVQDDTIQTPAAAAMIFDTDGDGLSDDMESRLKTDPRNSDSDGDGYPDGLEVANRFNPLGSGVIINDISAGEEALVKKQPLEHPKISGTVTEQMTVANVENTSEPASLDENDDKLQNTYQTFSGQGIPGSIVLLYIYSDLPAVVTTSVDQYGNWTYTLKESLKDGDHEAYITLNDNTGKILSKSEPFDFFIQGARAVTAADFFTPTPSTQNSTFAYIQSYLILSAIVTALGILLFVYFIIQERRRRKF